MLNKALLVLFVGVNLSLVAQNNYDEYARVYYRDYSPSIISDSVDFDQYTFGIGGGYGFEVGENDNELSLGLGYQYRELRLGKDSAQILGLNAGFVGGQFLHKWDNPNFATTYDVGLAWASDKEYNADQAYQTTLSAMIHYGKTEDLIWTAGIMYSDQPFGPWLFPIVNVEWKATQRLYVSATLLDQLYLEYAVVPDKLYMGIDVQSDGMSYLIQGDSDSTHTYISSFSESAPYYPYNAQLFADYYFNNGITIYAKGGMQVSQGFIHNDLQNEAVPFSPLNGQVTPAPVFEVGLAYRWRK